MKIILDTDIGYCTDPDDALALAYLLMHPDCELLGVTTVGLHSPWRARLASAVCAELGRRDVPVVAGADRPLCHTRYWPRNPVQPWPKTEGAATDQAAAGQFPPNRAVAWIGSAIRQAPGEITLITIGQFTNLATLLLSDPQAVEGLQAIVSMGGRMEYPPDRPEGECNVILDPVAAMIVFQRIETGWTLLPLDAVCGKALTGQEVREMVAGPSRRALRDACQAWADARDTKEVGLADPATCAVAVQPDLAAFATGRVGVRLHHHAVPGGEPFEQDELTGVTTFEESPAGPHRLVRSIDGERTHEHLSDVFARFGR